MSKLIFILLLFPPQQVSGDYPLKNGKPTSKGIEQYIEEQADSIIEEYQEFIGDTLYDIWIYADDLTYYEVHDSLELGRYYPNEIYISIDEKFIAYELADLSKAQVAAISESNKFVKATVIHELTHDYLYQIGIEMRISDSLRVDRSYQTNLWIIHSHETFGSEFIQEGICEYVTEKMGEVIPSKHPYIPKNTEELTSKENRYLVKYKYAAYYLRPFLDATGLKRGIKTLLYNPPPSFEEILNPDLFFSRLVPIHQ